MVIEKRKPLSRGVDSLMYVGNYGDVESVLQSVPPKTLGIGALAALVALKSKGFVRIGAAGVAAYVAYQIYQTQQAAAATAAATPAAGTPATSAAPTPPVTTTTPTATGWY